MEDSVTRYPRLLARYRLVSQSFMEVHPQPVYDSAYASEFASHADAPHRDVGTGAVFVSEFATHVEATRLDGVVDGASPLRDYADCTRMTIVEDEEFIYAGMSNAPSIKIATNLCAGCNVPISDRTILSADGRSWHELCLRCVSCAIPLHNQLTCYSKQGNVFCKPCYSREFGAKCANCDRGIQPTDWVRRARHFVYHLACFACQQCKRQLSTGEEFAIEDGRLLCKQHFVELVEGDSDSGSTQQKQKTKRVRTTFAEEQLSVLQAHFQIDSNPDGADLERIASITGLSKRVTQVWFQNSRARQKKYAGNGKGSGGGSAHGVATGDSGSTRSSEPPNSPGEKSETSSEGGMLYPTSVTTSAEDAMTDSTAALVGLHYE